MGYEFTADGRSYASAITVTWQLRDVAPGLGGFACVPGSHHTHLTHPPSVRNVEDHMNLVVQPSMRAGDVIFFIDGGLTHGATAWKNRLARRGVLMKYSARSVHRGGGDLVHPRNRWGEALTAGMDDAMLAVLRGPDRDAAHLNVPRLEVASDGAIKVNYEKGQTLYSDAAPTGPLAHAVKARL
jgi:hypothetical protein